jgi:hypothetical protein
MAPVMVTKRRAPPTTAYVPRSSGMMEFEPVSIDEARAALDEIDPSITALVGPEYWTKVRRKTQPTDRALTGLSMTWLAALPAELRPQITMTRYPRVINMLTQSWPDAEEREHAFDDLLNSRRRGRRGFPIDVERELSALCLYASALPR